MKVIFDRIEKSYGKTRALNAFSAELTSGIYALLGPNGSGKSTLMNILTDNLKADSGEIRYVAKDGTEENVLKMGVRFREKLGFMPQYPGMYPNFTVEAFLWYMAALKDVGNGMNRKTKNEFVSAQIDGILRAVELDDVKARKIKALSGGMKQRLALAQAVLGYPEILILDEPTAGLDPKQRIAIRNYIAGIAFSRIVIIATHLVSDIEFIARNVILLKQGEIIDNAPPADLLRKMEGKVWLCPVKETEITEMQSRFRVTGISREEATGAVLLRVLADAKPTPAAVLAVPTLEDYYLHCFNSSLQQETALNTP